MARSQKSRREMSIGTFIREDPEKGESRRNTFAIANQAQPTKIKVVGTFHVPSTNNPSKRRIAAGKAELACYFGQLCQS